MTAPAGRVTGVEGGAHPTHEGHGAVVVAEGVAQQRRLAVHRVGGGLARTGPVAADVVARPVAQRPDLAEAGEGGDHQAGEALEQVGWGEAPPLEHHRPEVGDEHVGALEQRVERRRGRRGRRRSTPPTACPGCRARTAGWRRRGRCAPTRRIGSPVTGSTLITSAPQSASTAPAAGPATQAPSSTTRTPCRGGPATGTSSAAALIGPPPRPRGRGRCPPPRTGPAG